MANFSENKNQTTIISQLLDRIRQLELKNKTLNTNNQSLIFPVLSFVASGGTTQLILINKVGDYKILAQTIDDTLGEALDKAARMLGLGYPGGAVLEKLAKDGDPNAYSLPIPLIGQEERMEFSYSGLKTAMYRLVEDQKPLTKNQYGVYCLQLFARRRSSCS